MSRPPFPPFTLETALQKVQAAEDAWNSRDPERVALAYTEDTVWRNRGEFVQGRDAVVAFLTRKWERELDYCLRKELWAFTENRIAGVPGVLGGTDLVRRGLRGEGRKWRSLVAGHAGKGIGRANVRG